MAALEEGDLEFKRENVTLHDLAERAASTSALRAGELGGSVTTELRASQSRVKGDALHLENAINSILDNAEKYSTGPPRIRVATRVVDGAIVLSVSDSGIGIEAKHLGGIFEKYYRVPTQNVHDVKGFGLGLSYVKLVVERHGGTVQAFSKPGSGTTIELRLPLDPADAS
jgi:two-component system phosphate regulon sensor histidine kinase PhoR